MPNPTLMPALGAETSDDRPVSSLPVSTTPASTMPASEGFGTTALPEVDRSSARPVLRARSVPRFVTTGHLGEGGLGDVVAALDEDIGRTVAIKRVRADRLSDAVLLRFVQEIRTVGRLEHANIIPIHDVGRDPDGALYFVMRHVDGETLEEVIAQLRAGSADYHRRFGFERRVQIIAAVLEALAFAHSQGVIHRDVKPANVMVGRYGEVMLLDWGIARLTNAPDLDVPDPEAEARPPQVGGLVQTRAGSVVGTPAYMSPEQARGEPVDQRSDVYAACVVLHEFLTLSHYLADCEDVEAMLAAVQTRQVPFASSVVSRHQDPVPMDLTWFVDQGVQKDPSQRYPTVDAMLERLARRAEGEIPVQCHVTFTKQATTRAIRFVDRHVIATAVVMLLGVLGLFVALLTGVALLVLGVVGAVLAS